MIYKWQESQWMGLLGQTEKLPHAILLSGPSGGGKAGFADALASRLLCENARGVEPACGVCHSCNWFSAGNHPDFRRVEPGGGDNTSDDEPGTEIALAQKKSDQIKIDQIRQLTGFLGIGSHRQGYRIILIRPAEAMNTATANSLLKSLEEPGKSTLFLLITNNKKVLLPTILSRCRILDFPKPDSHQALAWLSEKGVAVPDRLLAHAGGMPLAAIEAAASSEKMEAFFQDLMLINQSGPVAIAGRWESWLKEEKEGTAGIDKQTLVVWLQKWVFDLIAAALGAQILYHPHKKQEIFELTKCTPVANLIDCYNDLLKIKAVSRHPLNPRLFLEDILSRYARFVLSGR